MVQVIKVWLITAYSGDESATYLKSLEDIEKKMHIKVDFKMVSWGRVYECLVRAFREGNQPDLFALGTTWISTFAHLGYLEPVPNSMDIPLAVSPWVEKSLCYKGTKYAVPYYMSPPVLCVNQALMKQSHMVEADLKTFDGLYHACHQIDQYYKSIGDNVHVPFAFQVKPDTSTLHLFYAFLSKTGYLFSDFFTKKNYRFDMKLMYSVLDYMNSLVRISGNQPINLHMDYNQLYDKFYFLNQCTIYVDYTNNVVASIMDERINGNKADRTVEIFPIPSLGNHLYDEKTYAGGSVLAVASKSKKKELAWEFIGHLVSDEIMQAHIVKSGILPALETDFWKENIDEPVIQTMYHEIQKSISYPNHPLWRNIEGILADCIYKAFVCFGSVQKESIYQEVDKILNKSMDDINKLLDLTWEM